MGAGCEDGEVDGGEAEIKEEQRDMGKERMTNVYQAFLGAVSPLQKPHRAVLLLSHFTGK